MSNIKTANPKIGLAVFMFDVIGNFGNAVMGAFDSRNDSKLSRKLS